MSPHSPVCVEVDDFDREPQARRPRSAEDLDFLKDEERWNRRDRERQMVPYRDRNYFGATQRRTGADLLAVPEYASSPRRPRARSDTRLPHSDGLSRNYTTMEMRPSPVVISQQEIVSERVIAHHHERGSAHSKTPGYESLPKIKIPPVIVQEHPPDQKSGVSPGASPKSPSGRPQLRDKYLVLQNKLTDVALACVRYIDVEAANPQDLTFRKISEEVKGFTFELRVWSQIANIQNLARRHIPDDAKAILDAASRNIDRLVERTTELYDACLDAKPNDLKFEDLERMGDEDSMFEDGGDEQSEQDQTESVYYIINASLHSIKLQIRNLKRLTRSLQEATPDAREEVIAVSSRVAEVAKYFGSDATLDRYAVDAKYSGRRALEEARYAAAR